jgi:glycosyltransferase involved in cell wall biosynthesis
MSLLSIIIPSYKDPLIHKTINDLLNKSEGNIEIIAVLDGYWSDIPIITHKNVNVLHLGGNRGMRGAINAGYRISKGKYIMRVDEHCMFAKGYDTALKKDCQDNWIVTPRRFFLNPDKWEVMDLPPVDYERLVIQSVNGSKKFTGLPWEERALERKAEMIDETMAMQGSCWMMKRSWWKNVIKELQSEGYGTHLQDSHEMVFKTWKADGKLMINKNTWFAHKHVSFPRTHQYSKEMAEPCLKYSYETWKDYYYKEIKPKWKN